MGDFSIDIIYYAYLSNFPVLEYLTIFDKGQLKLRGSASKAIREIFPVSNS